MLPNLAIITIISSLCVLASTTVAPDPSPEERVDHRVRRIVGGESARIKEFTFAAHISWYLVRKYQKTKRIICSGVVLDKNFVLTAASCFETLVRENYNSKNKTMNRAIQLGKYEKAFVRAGTINGTRVKIYEHQERAVATVHIHPEYLHLSTMFDVNIALLRLREPFEFPSFFIVPASLGKRVGPSGTYVNNFCFGVGFGYATSKQANFSATPDPADIDLPEIYYRSTLKKFKVKAAASWFCKALEKNLTKANVHFDRFYLCAVSKNVRGRGYEHNCDGDVGGALVCGGIVVGVLSERREKVMCDVVGPSYSMYTAIGESVVYDWVKLMVPYVGAPVDIPFEDHVNSAQWYPDEPEP